MKNIRYILYLLTVLLGMTACSDNLIDDEGGTGVPGADKGIGQMVLFTAGRTNNQMATRADNDKEYSETPGETYYMGNASRFVCRMYYKAADREDAKFDITNQTKTVAWLVVDGQKGNSLYWNKNYRDVVLSSEGADKSDREKYDDYGNDRSATMFYWQNRRDHAFLAWTDLNKATSIIGGESKGNLKMDTDVTYEEHTGKKEKHYVLSGFKVVGDNGVVKSSFKEMLDAAIPNYASISATDAQTAAINTMPEITDYSTTYVTGWNNIRYYYNSGEVQRHDEVKDGNDHTINYNYGPYVYYVWSENQRLEYVFETGDVVEQDTDGKYWVKNSSGIKVAQRGEAYQAPDGYTQRGDPYDYTNDEAQFMKYHFWAVRYSEFLYDITQVPAYTIALYRYYEEKEAEVINEYEALEFDLTRGTSMHSIADQPDPCQALTIMKPEGATQAANRVNLYFKHKFSQVQVNIKNAADNSVELAKEDIDKVELLGVTEKGYVFTEIDENGKVHEAAYADINWGKYSAEDLKKNQYGTAFNMFEMETVETGYLKSYNAITFGQLQAIRVTWHENKVTDGISEPVQSHAATFRIPSTELMNLKSGVRYIWNIEIRRGTLAIIRTEIVDWELPKDTDHNGNVDGTIQN